MRRYLLAAALLLWGAPLAHADTLAGMGAAGPASGSDTLALCQNGAPSCGTTDPLRRATLDQLKQVFTPSTVPAKIIVVPCASNLTSVIAANGGGASAFAPVLYQLAGSAAIPCTYSGYNPAAVSNIIIQGDLASPVGANTIIDGGEQGGAASNGCQPFLNGMPTSVSQCGLAGSGAANVIIQYVTIQNYGGGHASGVGFGSTCGWVAYMGDPSENWCPILTMGNGWALQHSTLQFSGGYAIQTVGGGIVIANNLITTNQHGGATIQSGWTGTNGGPIVVQNNEFTGNNARGDDPTNDAIGAFKAVYQGTTGLGGGPQQALYAVNNYVHDNNAGGFWCDIQCSNELMWTGNTVIRALSPSAYSFDHPACYTIEITGGHGDVAHNFAAECAGLAYGIVTSANVSLHDNYGWVDLDLGGAGLGAYTTCRIDVDKAADPLSNIKAFGNVVAFNKTVPAGASPKAGAYDLTGPLGASCSGGQSYPTVYDYATNQFYGNQYYVPAFSGTVGAGIHSFGAGTIAAALSVAQGTGGPWAAPFYSNAGYAGYATGDCTLHVTTIPSGFTIQEGMSLWGSAGGSTTPMTISAAGGGTGDYAINFCPITAGQPTPIALSGAFPGNQEIGSVLQTGASAASSSIAGTTLTTGAVTGAAIAAGMTVYGNDGTHTVPFGTYIVSGSGSTWTINNSLTLTSTTAYFNQGRALHLGCQNGIALGGCPNGSGM